MMFTHTDHRRTLIEWAQGSFKVAKAVIAGKDCIVGDHYHRHKDEKFLLLSGRASEIVLDTCTYADVKAPFEIEVPRNTYHRFTLDEGSVLLGVGTEEFDASDEIKGRPTQV